jgi:hypothetical protein
MQPPLQQQQPLGSLVDDSSRLSSPATSDNISGDCAALGTWFGCCMVACLNW